MASLVAILGLLPASLATGLGSDVQRPLATVIVWGLFSSTVLTLFVVPVLYRIVSPGLPKPEEPEEAPPLDPEAAQHHDVQPRIVTCSSAYCSATDAKRRQDRPAAVRRE